MGLCIQWLMPDLWSLLDVLISSSLAVELPTKCRWGVAMHPVGLSFRFEGCLSTVTGHDCER